MEVKHIVSYLGGHIVEISINDEIVLDAYLDQITINSEYYDDVYITYASTRLCYRLIIYCYNHIEIPYNNIAIIDKYNALCEHINDSREGTITPEDEMYSMIMEVRQFLTYKLKCILNVMTKDYIASISDVDIHGFANEIIDIFDSSLTKSARK